ncbi:MAG: hypothetical protein OEM26_08095 [Saprospiraceae bacterium]|nr:hypothetical protein [Saprospiraceae bacterium]
MEENLDDQQVRKYLAGELKGDELTSFMELLRTNETLKSEVQGLQDLELGLESLGMDAFRDRLNQWENQVESKGRNVFNIRSLLSVAAVIVLLVAAGIFLFLPRSTDPDILFTQYYSPYEDMLTSRASEIDEVLQEGMFAYNSADYATAVKHFNNHLSTDSPRAASWLYRGISYLELDDIDRAIESFENILDHPLLGQQAQWYQALALLKANRLEEGKSLLLEIGNLDDHYRLHDAISIYQALK